MAVFDDTIINDLFINHHKGIAQALDTMSIEGLGFKVVGHGKDIKPGDTYIAERNVGLKVLTCKENNQDRGWIVPVESAYSYDTGECIKIEFLID